MHDGREKTFVCPDCGHRYLPALGACPACQRAGGPVGTNADAWSDWVRARDSLKTKWVASVLAFWVSVAVLGVVFVMDGKLNLILASIALGMLVVGMWLKTGYQRHLRKEPGRH